MSFELSTKRHSFAHILAQAIQRYVDPHVQLGTGPATDTGCYYDIAFSDGIDFGEDDLKDLTNSIQFVAKEKQTYVCYECDLKEGYTINELTGQALKNELLDKFKEQGEDTVSYYLNVGPAGILDHIQNTEKGYQKQYQKVTEYFRDKGTITDDQAVLFIDLCGGPHVESHEDLNPKGAEAEKLAGAYRQADENNQMMTRIYVQVFEDKKALRAHQNMMEEARKRDHRRLGEELKLFTISPLVGAGMPLLQPNGMILRQEAIDYLWELHKARGYQQVWTPHLAKEALYETSGHADKFGDELFRVKGKDENDQFYMKPMNCPHHMQIFGDNQFSYRDMPVRYFEPGTVYRDEKKGQLSGLTRVRSISQDDGHLFCRITQLEEEVGTIIEIIKEFYATVGMVDEYSVSLSIRGDDQSQYLGSNEVWEKAEKALEDAAKAHNLPYEKIEGEAAFYGPKLDFMFNDAIGREWQLATIQADFNLPERFDLSFTNEDGEDERPVVIHRAISGSIERFMGVMIEHFAGAFPVWLAPVQSILVPVADPFNEYAQEVTEQLKDAGIRAQIDTSDDSLNKKIRNAEKQKIPYILVVGEQEENSNTVNVRTYKTGEQNEIPVEEFIINIMQEYEERRL